MRALIILTGNVGRPPELRYTPTGDAVASFSLAVSYGKNINGQWINETEWFNVSVWGQQAERAVQQLQKGNQVLVEGTIRSREYEVRSVDDQGGQRVDQQGNPIQEKRFSMDVRANYFRNQGRRMVEENAGAGQPQGGYVQQPAGQPQGGYVQQPAAQPQGGGYVQQPAAQPQQQQPAPVQQPAPQDGGGESYEDLPW